MNANRGKIAYVLKGFPRLSESFIANEIRILSQMNLTLGLFSIKHGDALALDDALPPIHYLPSVSSLSQTTLRTWLKENYPQFAVDQQFWLEKHPLRYARTLLFAIRCAIRYRRARAGGLKKTFIKEFLLASHIAREIECDGHFMHVHAHFCHDATTVAWMVSRLTALPFSFTAHAKDIYKKDLNPGDLLRRKLAAAKFTVTCTNANVSYLRDQTAAPDKIVGIYHGLNTRTFVPPQRNAAQVMHRQSGPTRLLSVGRLVEKKGFIYLIEACRLLKGRGVSFDLDIVGEGGDQIAAIQEAIDTYELQQHVTLQPPVPQAALLKYYQEAEIFVLPCVVLDDGDRDGIPNVMAEAMACSLPVVVSRISGIPELVESAVNGLLVPPRDARHLANAIERLIRSPKLRNDLGTAARQRIESVFDAETTHDQLRDLFNDVLAPGTSSF